MFLTLHLRFFERTVLPGSLSLAKTTSSLSTVKLILFLFIKNPYNHHFMNLVVLSVPTAKLRLINCCVNRALSYKRFVLDVSSFL